MVTVYNKRVLDLGLKTVRKLSGCFRRKGNEEQKGNGTKFCRNKTETEYSKTDTTKETIKCIPMETETKWKFLKNE